MSEIREQEQRKKRCLSKRNMQRVILFFLHVSCHDLCLSFSSYFFPFQVFPTPFSFLCSHYLFLSIPFWSIALCFLLRNVISPAVGSSTGPTSYRGSIPCTRVYTEYMYTITLSFGVLAIRDLVWGAHHMLPCTFQKEYGDARYVITPSRENAQAKWNSSRSTVAWILVRS